MTYTVRYRDRDVAFERAGGPSIERYLSQGRFYEPDMLEYIEALQLPGVYIDVGAYVGTHSVFFAMFCPASRVHAFEPVAEFHEVLARNIAANQLGDRVRLHRIGLSDVTQTVETELEGKRSIIDCRRLDELVDEPVSLIKIDVEGMELAVLRGAEALLRQYRPLVFFEAHTSEQREECARFLAQFGYQGTGRVFNSSPTYEFVDAGSPTAPRRVLPRERSLLAPSMWRLRPSDSLRLGWRDDALTGVVDLAEGARVHVSHDERAFEEPPGPEAPDVQPGGTVFLQLGGTVDGTATVAVHLFQYADGTLLGSERIGSLPRLFRKIVLDGSTTAIRLVLRVAGKGSFRIDHFALHERPEQQVDWLQAEVRRLRGQRARERGEHELRITALREEIRAMRAEYQRMSQACDEALADAAHHRDQVQAYETILNSTFRRLESSRKSVSFRIGRATRSALSGSRKNPLAVPRRWLDTFRGRDEILEDLRGAGVIPKPAGQSRAEIARIESEVLLLGLPEATRTTGVAGIVGPRLADDLAAATRFRGLEPHSWRTLLEAEPPAYVLITADGLLPGTAWSEWGTPGGRDGAALLRELVAWCRSRHLPVVYWDTVGTARPLPRGASFDAVFSISERGATRLGPGAEVLAPGIEPRIWNPIGVAQATPRHPLYAGAYDRRGDLAELAVLDALLESAAGRGLEILDANGGLQGKGAAAVRFPDRFAALVRRRLPAAGEREAIKRAGIQIAGNAAAGLDVVSWELLRGVALGAHVLATPAELGDSVLARAVELADGVGAAAEALDRLAARPLLDATWARAFDRILTRYSLRDRLDQIARRIGTARVAEPPPGLAVIARLQGSEDVAALRGFLAAQTMAPTEVRVTADRGLDAEVALGEVVDRERIAWLRGSDALLDSPATHLLCWSPGTPVVPHAISELTRAASLAGDAVIALDSQPNGAGAALFAEGAMPASAVIAVPRAAAAADLRAGRAPAEIVAALAGAGRRLILSHGHRGVA